MGRSGDDRLTPANVRAMRKGDTLRDDTVTGLELRCGSQRKSWRLYYRTRGGVERRPTLGAWPTLNIEAARKAARDLLVRVARGEDPSAEWQDERSAPTIADLWPKYLAWLKSNRAERTWSEYERQVKSLMQPHALWHMKVRDVQLADVEAWVADVRSRRFTKHHKPGNKESVHAGTRASATLSGMFKHAELRTGSPPWRPRGTNPVTGVTRPAGRKRRRYATADELAAIGQALRALEPAYPLHVALLRVLLFTGARTSEIANARWVNLSVDRSALLLRDHKTSRTHGDKLIELPMPARNEIARLARMPLDSGGYIFGALANRKSPVEDLWDKVRKQSGCPDLQIRDLRRTFASLAYDPTAPDAANSKIIGGLLGHSNMATTEIYTVLFAETRQRAASGAANRAAGMLAGDALQPADGGDGGDKQKVSQPERDA